MGIRDLPIDICRLFRGDITSNLVNIFAEDLKKHTNIFHGCPFKGHICVNGMPVNLSYFPDRTPSGKYMSQVAFYRRIGKKEIFIGQYRVYYNIFNRQ